MKSCSSFFPARLMSAEIQGDLAEDVYLLKPNNSPDKSVELAVTHLSPLQAGQSSDPRPVFVLLHGCYQNRQMWFSSRQTNMAQALISLGVDVWLVEHRGHGLSPQNQRYENNSLNDYAYYDIPAVNTFVTEHTGAKPHWFGVSEGAGSLLLALALGTLSEGSVSSVIGMGEPFPAKRWARLGLQKVVMPLYARQLTYNLQIGPDREPANLFRHLLGESSWLSKRGAAVGIDLWEQLLSVDCPMAWISGLPQLSELDNGFSLLQQRELISNLSAGLTADDFSLENIGKTLDAEDKIENLVSSLMAFVEFLPPRDTEVEPEFLSSAV